MTASNLGPAGTAPCLPEPLFNAGAVAHRDVAEPGAVAGLHDLVPDAEAVEVPLRRDDAARVPGGVGEIRGDRVALVEHLGHHGVSLLDDRSEDGHPERVSSRRKGSFAGFARLWVDSSLGTGVDLFYLRDGLSARRGGRLCWIRRLDGGGGLDDRRREPPGEIDEPLEVHFVLDDGIHPVGVEVAPIAPKCSMKLNAAIIVRVQSIWLAIPSFTASGSCGRGCAGGGRRTGRGPSSRRGRFFRARPR